MTKSLREALEESINDQKEPEETIEEKPEVEAAEEINKDEPEATIDEPEGKEPEQKADDSEEEPEQEDKPELKADEEAQEDEPEDEPEPIKPPQALAKDIKAKWREIPRDIQEEFARIEAAQQKGVQKIAQSARYGEEMQKLVQPYEAIIRASNTTPNEVIGSLLNANYVLKTGTPAQKQQMIQAIAQQFEVPLEGITEPVKIDPTIQNLTNTVNNLQNTLNDQRTAAEQQALEQLSAEIERFGSDPENVYFEAVREDMATEIEIGRAKTLKEAYEKACRLNGYPIDSKPVPKENGAGKKKKAPKVVDKQKAAKSIKGGSGETAKTSPSGDLRSTIEKQIYQTTERL